MNPRYGTQNAPTTDVHPEITVRIDSHHRLSFLEA